MFYVMSSFHCKKISKLFPPAVTSWQWELQDRSSEFTTSTQNPQSAKSLHLPECAAATSVYEHSFFSGWIPGSPPGRARPFLNWAVQTSSLKARRCPGPSVRCSPCVCVSPVPQGGPRGAGGARRALCPAEQLRGKPRPRGPQSPPRPCPRYLRRGGGGRRAPLVERGGRPCARVERRAEAGGGQAEGPVRILHPRRGQGTQEADRERTEGAGSGQGEDGEAAPLRPRRGGPGAR